MIDYFDSVATRNVLALYACVFGCYDNEGNFFFPTITSSIHFIQTGCWD